jgi:tetratricopeptide (TPR) repeat protein
MGVSVMNDQLDNRLQTLTYCNKVLWVGGLRLILAIAIGSSAIMPARAIYPPTIPSIASSALSGQELAARAEKKYKAGDKQGALEDLNQAIKLQPDLVEAYQDRGLVRLQLGDKRGALADFTQALKLKPDEVEVYNARGLIRHDLGDYQGASADFTQSLKLKSDSPGAYYHRGKARHQLGDKQGAIADYNQAINLKPDYDDAYNGRGLVRSDLGDKQGAIADYDQALKLHPNDAIVHYNRGVARAGVGGNDQGAMADLQKAAKLFQQQGDTSSYQDALKRIKELQSRSSGAAQGGNFNPAGNPDHSPQQDQYGSVFNSGVQALSGCYEGNDVFACSIVENSKTTLSNACSLYNDSYACSKYSSLRGYEMQHSRPAPSSTK